MEKNINFFLEKICLILIIFLPIALLVGSGVSTAFEITITIFFLIISINNKDLTWIFNKYFILLLILWSSLIINIFFSQDLSLSFARNFFFFKNIIFIFALIYFFNKKENLDLIFSVYLIILLVVSFDIIFEFTNKKNIFGFSSTDPTRIASFLKNELKIAHFMLGFLFITIGYFLENKTQENKFKKFIIYFFFTFFFISILLTGERANSLKAILILLMFIIFLRYQIIKFKKITVFFFLILTMALYSQSVNIKHRFDIYFNSIKKNNIIEAFKETQHGAHYYTAIRIFNAYPITGVGNKNFRNECSKIEYENFDYKKTKERCSTHPHQVYLEFLSEHGLLGTIIIISVIFYILFESIKIYSKNKNSIHLASILFIISQLLPIIPSGSFFTNWNATIFWFNFSILVFFNNKNFKKAI